jgi:hypothetical protein
MHPGLHTTSLTPMALSMATSMLAARRSHSPYTMSLSSILDPEPLRGQAQTLQAALLRLLGGETALSNGGTL